MQIHLRQFHGHKHTTGKERCHHTEESKGELHRPAKLGQACDVGALQDHKAQGTKGEEKARSQPFHDVLPVDPIRHEGNGAVVTAVVRGGAYGGRLHDDVIDNPSGYEEVGEEDEPVNCHG